MTDQEELRRAVREMVDEFGRAADQAAKLVKEAVGDLTRTVGRQTSAPDEPASAIATGGDPFEAIRQLATLRDEGHITDAEFTAKKTQIMERL